MNLHWTQEKEGEEMLEIQRIATLVKITVCTWDTYEKYEKCVRFWKKYVTLVIIDAFKEHSLNHFI